MRGWIWLVALVLVMGVGAGMYLLRPVGGPPRDLTLAADATQGAYLLRLGGCVSCHTDSENGVAELAGGAPLVTAFGSFVPPNITSHPEAGIGGWSVEQFSRAMSDGEGSAGHLYPAFPYDSYTLMSDQEIVDLYAALQAVPPVAGPAPPHQVPFPFNVRLAMAGWKNLFFEPRRYEPVADQSELWNRGRYIVFGPGHCVACHSPRNLLGAIEAGAELTGNREGGPGGRTPSLRPEDLRDEDYDQASLVEALRTGFTPGFDVLGGPMGEVVAEGTSHWKDDDLAAVATYLLEGEEGWEDSSGSD